MPFITSGFAMNQKNRNLRNNLLRINRLSTLQKKKKGGGAGDISNLHGNCFNKTLFNSVNAPNRRQRNLNANPRSYT